MLSMPSERTHLALTAILEDARLARTISAGHTEEIFEANRRTYYAVTRCLDFISEASRRLAPDLRERHRELPWRAIMGVGNFYRHDNDNVDGLHVWRTVRDSLFQFRPSLRARSPDSMLTK
jgi:uncharacterized protein with HEPN domain